MSCICETGEGRQSEFKKHTCLISVYKSKYNGAWHVDIDYDDYESGGCYGPIFYCPICGRKLEEE